MPLTLYVDEPRWTEHLEHTVKQHPRIIPMVTGNAYGFGIEILASRAQPLGVDAIAVGIYDELQQVMGHFDGDVMVMTPWRPAGELPHLDVVQMARVIQPQGVGTLARRALRVAKTGPGSAAQWLSPFEFNEEQCWLSEPPHMQASSLFFPDGDPVPEVGDEIVTHLDFASVVFDRVRFV